MEILTPNLDPSLRFFATCEISQQQKVSSEVAYFLAAKGQMDEHFPNSQAITQYFSETSHMDWCMIICLYHTPGHKEVRRRMVRTQMPKNTDDLLTLIKMVGSQLGVDINFKDTHPKLRVR